LKLSLVFQGMSSDDAQRLWKPFRAWVEEHPESFAIKIKFDDIPADKMWNHDILKRNAPEAIRTDERAGAPPELYWWTGDGDQVSIYWYAYQSRWIPLDRFAEAKKFAAVLFEASRQWTVGLHFNKGQAGASADAVRRGRETSVNPALYKAAALAIIGAGGDALPGVPGHEPDLVTAKDYRTRVGEAMRILRDATPGAGSYVNETDYFEPDWKRAFWGENYDKLLEIKRKYDPHALFFCHHCVGSDEARAKH
jgi:hypothetical protein